MSDQHRQVLWIRGSWDLLQSAERFLWKQSEKWNCKEINTGIITTLSVAGGWCRGQNIILLSKWKKRVQLYWKHKSDKCFVCSYLRSTVFLKKHSCSLKKYRSDLSESWTSAKSNKSLLKRRTAMWTRNYNSNPPEPETKTLLPNFWNLGRIKK